MAIRIDALSDLSPPTETAEGYLRVSGYATREGVFAYTRPDGTVTREYRPREEVLAAASVDTLSGVPLTIEHPREGIVTPSTVAAQSHGTVRAIGAGETTPDGAGAHLPVDVTVWSEAGKRAIADGVRELSCGYVCDVDLTPGEWNGERYDSIQRNIRYNHLALTRKGRAGASVALRLDSEDLAIAGEWPAQPEQENVMAIRIDGQEVDADKAQAAVDAVCAERDSARTDGEDWKAKHDAIKAKYDALKEKMDAMKAKADEEEEKGKRADSDAAFLAAFGERKRLLELATAHRVDGSDALANGPLKVAIAKVLAKDAARCDSDAAYVDAVIDLAGDTAKRAEQSRNDAASAFAPGSKPEPRVDAHGEYMARITGKAKSATPAA